MKRDLDLIRDILLQIEESNSEVIPITVLSLCKEEDYSDFALLSTHIKLLLDSKYIEAEQMSNNSYGLCDFRIHRITSSGYDYLDTVRDDSIWSTIKSKIKTISNSAALDVVKSVGIDIIKSKLIS